MSGFGAACSQPNDSSSASTTARPSSEATVAFVRPVDSAVVGKNVEVEVRIDGGRIVGPTGSPMAGDRGHVHLVLDGGEQAQMLYGPTYDLGRLERGPHTLQAEFVATDHLPFANRPNTTIVFEVR
jgi:hypothetical protein